MAEELKRSQRRIEPTLLVAYRCSLQDMKGRLRTLQLELRHLQQTSAVLLGDSDYFQWLAYEDACRTCFPVSNFVTERALPHSATAHAHHLILSAQLLKVDIYRDLSRVRVLRDGNARESIRMALLDALQTGETLWKWPFEDEAVEGERASQPVPRETSGPPDTPLLLMSQIVNSQSTAGDSGQVLYKDMLELLFDQFVNSTGEMRLLDGAEIDQRIDACLAKTIGLAKDGLEQVDRLVWKDLDGTEEQKSMQRDLLTVQREAFTDRFKKKMQALRKSRPEHFRGLRHIDSATANLVDLRYLLFVQAALRQRLRLYAERVGFLQNRLGQYVEQNNPRHAPPTVRRRQENAFTDRFLNELARWSHRDLVVLVRNYWKDPYPYSSLPSTFQYWEYNYMSRFSQYLPEDEYHKWRRLREQAISSGKASGEVAAKAMVVVQQSFWLHDRAALTPVVGHELAHYVIRGTTHGPNLLPQASEVDLSGHLGDLVRRITQVVEAWTAPFAASRHFRIEILSDLMAATRFGHAFLYAWMLENLDQEELAEQLADEYQELDLRMAPERAKHPRAVMPGQLGVPQIYLRGRALVAWLELVQDPDGQYERQLRQAVRQHLELMLDTICEKATATAEYWRACGADLAEQFRSSSATRRAQAFRRAFSGGLPGEDQDTGKLPVWFARVQKLSEFVRTKAKNFLGEDARNSLWTVTDLPWILEWTDGVRDQANVDGKTPTDEDASREIRRQRDPAFLYSLAMEDYLHRVNHPQRIWTRPQAVPENNQMLARRVAALAAIKRSNDLDVVAHKRGWTERLVETRRAMLEGTGASDHVSGDLNEQLDTGTLYGDIGQWFSGDLSFARLDLLTISVDEGVYQAEASGPDGEVLYRDQAAVPLAETLRADKEWGLFGLDHQQMQGQRPRSAGVLGRYDRFFLTQDATRLWDGAWEKLYVPFSGRFMPGCDGFPKPHQPGKLVPCYVTRRRMLKAVTLPGPPPRLGNGDCAIVLVGLHWEGLRLPFVNWLLKNHEQCSTGGQGFLVSWICEAYLSNGWEDIVLFMRPPQGAPPKWTPEGLKQLSQRIKQIYNHRFVERTETLLPSRIIDHFQTSNALSADADTSAGIRIGYLVRIRGRKDEFEKAFFKAVAETLQGDADKVELAHISGLMDYRIGAGRLTFFKSLMLYKLLLGLQGVARIETSLRFDVESGLAPPNRSGQVSHPL